MRSMRLQNVGEIWYTQSPGPSPSLEKKDFQVRLQYVGGLEQLPLPNGNSVVRSNKIGFIGPTSGHPAGKLILAIRPQVLHIGLKVQWRMSYQLYQLLVASTLYLVGAACAQ